MRISDWSSDVCSSDLSGAQFVSAIFQHWFAISYRVPAGQPAWVDGKDNLADLDRSSDDFGFLRPLFDPCRTRSRSDLLFERMLRGGRSEERRVGRECVSTCGSSGSLDT